MTWLWKPKMQPFYVKFLDAHFPRFVLSWRFEKIKCNQVGRERRDSWRFTNPRPFRVMFEFGQMALCITNRSLLALQAVRPLSGSCMRSAFFICCSLGFCLAKCSNCLVTHANMCICTHIHLAILVRTFRWHFLYLSSQKETFCSCIFYLFIFYSFFGD